MEKKNKGTKQKEKVDVAICDLIIFIAWKQKQMYSGLKLISDSQL